jgi:hypothetical protein
VEVHSRKISPPSVPVEKSPAAICTRFHISFAGFSLEANFIIPQGLACNFIIRPSRSPQLWEGGRAGEDWTEQVHRSNTIAATRVCIPHGDLAAWAGLPGGDCHTLARHWEQDFLLLLPDTDGQPVFVAGAVCFPSSWATEEKLGLTVPAIHSSVPTLNERLGKRIGNFLAGIRPGKGWERVNWGISATADLNQHPALGLARLQPPFVLDQVWVRREDQVLFRLPVSGALIFGIHVTNISVSEIAADPQGRLGLRQTLQTMPAEIAVYKGRSAGRPLLLELLAGNSSAHDPA